MISDACEFDSKKILLFELVHHKRGGIHHNQCVGHENVRIFQMVSFLGFDHQFGNAHLGKTEVRRSIKLTRAPKDACCKK
jgi:hypothetical protein